ncbi:hypothetical protein LEMLEM_LOCUS7812 [Lemmus lemmus]
MKDDPGRVLAPSSKLCTASHVRKVQEYGQASVSDATCHRNSSGLRSPQVLGPEARGRHRVQLSKRAPATCWASIVDKQSPPLRFSAVVGKRWLWEHWKERVDASSGVNGFYTSTFI